MTIDTFFFKRCISSLERAMREVNGYDGSDDVLYDLFRAAAVKEFELTLEQSGALLRKRLAAYFSSNHETSRIRFKDLFRQAARYDLLDSDAVERWLGYRDCRNDTAHLYGEAFADIVLDLLPEFVSDAKTLAEVIELNNDD